MNVLRATACLLALVPAAWADGGFLSGRIAQRTSLRVVAGEAEHLLLELPAGPFRVLHLSLTQPPGGVRLEVFRVARVPGDGSPPGGLPDVLEPLAPDGHLLPADEGEQLLLKVTAAPETSAGRYLARISEAGGGELELSIEVLNIRLDELPPATLQAGIWRPPEGSFEHYEELVGLLKAYRFNALAGWMPREMPGRCRLADLVLDELGYRQLRLPRGPGGFSLRHGLQEDPEDWRKRWCAHVEKFWPLLHEPAWAGRFVAKLWDEPQRKQYRQVRLTHKLARSCAQGLRFELTEEPSDALAGVVDIWIPLLSRFKAERVAPVQKRQEEHWLYANSWHGINRASGTLRAVGWALWAWSLDGYHFWGVNRWRGDPWTTVSSQQADFFKRGTLVYPALGTGRPLASLRLEAFRDGIEDYLLLRQLDRRAKDDPACRRLATELRSRMDNWLAEGARGLPLFPAWREELLAALLQDSRTHFQQPPDGQGHDQLVAEPDQ